MTKRLNTDLPLLQPIDENVVMEPTPSQPQGKSSKRPQQSTNPPANQPQPLQPSQTNTTTPSTGTNTSHATSTNAPPTTQINTSQGKRARTPKLIPLMGEILKSVLTLDNGLKLTATPSSGFPTPQLGDSVWKNIPPAIQARWSQKPGAKAWVRTFRARFEENAQSTVAKIRNVITQLIGSQRATDLLISPPTAEEPIPQRYAPPWNFLISGIPYEAIETLTNLAICSTAEVTCLFIPFEQPVPNYICTVENFTFQDSEKSNLLIAKIIRDTLRECPTIAEFIYHHALASNSDTVMNALESIRVTSLNLAISKSETVTVWNIYCDNLPRLSLEDFFLWAALIRNLRFPSDDYGTGLPRLNERQFVCTGCKSLDHPTGLCPLPNIPGWLGPASASPKEDLSMTTLDARMQGSPSLDSRSNIRGSTRGRGGRGRGGQGPRGGRGGPQSRGFKP